MNVSLIIFIYLLSFIFLIQKGMVEHNGECKPFDFCPSLYNSTPETTSTPTGSNCNNNNNGREEVRTTETPAIGLPQPQYLSVPNWQSCTDTKWSEDCSFSFHCLPAEKPAACLEDSWSQLHAIDDWAPLESC